MRFLGIPTLATLKPYQHASLNFNNTSNPFIEGDNLEVLKRLYNPYFGRIKVIYPHPPYNTGKDFVYPGNYTEPLEPYQDSKPTYKRTIRRQAAAITLRGFHFDEN